jgi:predicted kinase
MRKLEILCGPIASGKSTYCRQVAEKGAIIISDDAIVTALHGGLYGQYRESLKPLYKSVENMAIQMGLSMGLLVVVDRPNYSRAMRRRYIGLAKSLDAQVEIVMMRREQPEVHAARRQKSDSRGCTYQGWVEAAQMHEELYEPPCQATEGFDSLKHWEP